MPGKRFGAFVFIDLEDRAVVNARALGTVPDSVFEVAAQECPERAIIIEAASSEV